MKEEFRILCQKDHYLGWRPARYMSYEMSDCGEPVVLQGQSDMA